jgi:hypothetical protein
MTVSDEMCGRVKGFFITAFMGFAPIGSIFAGSIAEKFSAPATVASGGIILLISAFLLKDKILRK